MIVGGVPRRSGFRQGRGGGWWAVTGSMGFGRGRPGREAVERRWRGGGGEGTGVPPSSDRTDGVPARHPLREGPPETPPYGAADAPPRPALPRAAGRNRPPRGPAGGPPTCGRYVESPCLPDAVCRTRAAFGKRRLPGGHGGHGPDRTMLAGGRTGCVRAGRKVLEGCGPRGGVGWEGHSRDPPATPPTHAITTANCGADVVDGWPTVLLLAWRALDRGGGWRPPQWRRQCGRREIFPPRATTGQRPTREPNLPRPARAASSPPRAAPAGGGAQRGHPNAHVRSCLTPPPVVAAAQTPPRWPHPVAGSRGDPSPQPNTARVWSMPTCIGFCVQ